MDYENSPYRGRPLAGREARARVLDQLQGQPEWDHGRGERHQAPDWTPPRGRDPLLDFYQFDEFIIHEYNLDYWVIGLVLMGIIGLLHRV